MSQRLPSELEVIHANTVLREACVSLFNTATASGLSVQAPPVDASKDKDVLAEGQALQAYHGQLSAVLAGARKTAAQAKPATSNADVATMHARLRETCAALSESIRARGQPVPMPPVETGSVLHDFVALTNYHEQLLFLDRKAATTLSPAASKRATGARASVAVPSVSVAALSAEEIKALTWTEKAQLAGGHMSIEQARVAIANRDAAKAGKGQNVTERLLAAKGAKDTEQARTLSGCNPFPNLD